MVASEPRICYNVFDILSINARGFCVFPILAVVRHGIS
jgi:hypothetical protein